jgi:hypothetical protein
MAVMRVMVVTWLDSGDVGVLLSQGRSCGGGCDGGDGGGAMTVVVMVVMVVVMSSVLVGSD